METARGPGWRIAIDRGGTFTDVVAWDPAGGLHFCKVLSQDSRDATDPAVRGIEKVLRAATPAVSGADPAERELAAVAIDWLRVGSTVATNALLERNGEPTLLVTTRGHGDALRIGYQQRPDIFARAIQVPAPLYARVVEADERVDVHGNVLQPLDEPDLERALSAARREGLQSVAIAFLHGFRHPLHERKAAALARRAGFAEVVTSHETAAVQGFIARGDTAVADAYLSPVLVRYLAGLRADLERRGIRAPLSFMQSHGGLIDATAARGVNGVLSGPAGGVIGMVAAVNGSRTGSAPPSDRRLIGLDMGGTSTDVSLYARALPRRPLTEIDGVRIQAPMMDVHTIAAGGGSIVRFRDGRLRAGPDSAGAHPGPACYGRGGPATLTDCNLVLGRIQPALLPRIFGADARSALDADAARQRLAAILAEVAADMPPAAEAYTLETLASAFVDVANSSMANAVRELALRYGEDATQFALVCFGGAAGQHACAIAEQLDIDEILLHPLCGVLSAYGIGLASRGTIVRRTVELPLESAQAPSLAAIAHDAATAAAGVLERQGVAGTAIATTLRAALRLPNSDTALEVRWDAHDAMRAEFAESHARLFGLKLAAAPLIVAAIVAESTEHAQPDQVSTLPAVVAATSGFVQDGARSHRDESAAVWDGDTRVPAHVFAREDLHPGATLPGPALVAETGATIWIAGGWSGCVDEGGVLVLRRQRAERRLHAGTGPTLCDPRRLEVFNGLYMHIAEQMGAVLERTASSVNIKERRDFSCAIFDADAALVANAPHMPVHLGSMGASVAAVVGRFGPDLRRGDAFLVNSPYAGGTHLPDLTVVTPFYVGAGERPFAFVASRAHHADVGGMTPGSMPPWSRSIDEEGALIEPTCIVRDSVLDEHAVRRLLASCRWPARDPARNLEDLRAQLAANSRGVSELAQACDRYGHETVRAYLAHVQDNAERCMRRAIRELGSGSFRYELDNGQFIAVRVEIDRERGAAIVDFGGTSAQSDNNFNAPRAVTVAAVMYVFRTLIDEPIPMNAGCLRPLTIAVPRGSLLDPRPPGAVVAGNVETSQCIVDALYGALGVLAASQGTMNNFTFGNATHQYYETIAGGAGAGPLHDGASGVQTHMTNSRLTDPEVLEQRFPVLLREFSLRAGSGGDGRHRGGDGLVRTLEFREAMTVAILANHRRIAPFGLAGGAAGQTGRNVVVRRDGGSELLAGSVQIAVEPGDIVSIETPGGGGYGSRTGGRRDAGYR